MEKEPALGLHQSGRNSGVIHSGVYYQPGSERARLCLRGRRRMVDFCEREGVPYEMCGKVIVAATESETARLRMLHDRGRQNGVRCTLMDPKELREREPYVRGLAALHIRDAGIVDFRGALLRMALRAQEHGTTILTDTPVLEIRTGAEHVTLAAPTRTMRARQVLNCAGLYADRIALLGGQQPTVRIVPFRGEYYRLRSQVKNRCRHLIYPAGNPALPFLGIHLTRMTDGRVLCGPSAVLGFAREGYRLTNVNLRDLAGTVAYRGFLRLAARHWRTGMAEMARSCSKRFYLRSLHRLVPDLAAADLLPARSGVRAMCVTPRGALVRGMHLCESERMVSALGTASPSATASLSIGQMLARMMDARCT